VKPAPFDYVAPTTVEEAVEALAEDGAVVLAGGQSLVLELVYRDQRPRLLVDVNAVGGLSEVREDDHGLRLGALVRHAQLEQGGAGPVRRLLAQVAPYVAHPPIRARGTFCGSLAWGHPAAEWNAVALVLDAEVHVRGTGGARVVAAADWFVGERRTSRRPDELVVEVVLPVPPAGTAVGFAEHRRTHASFADVAVVAAALVRAGQVEQVRLGVAGLADRPVRLSEVEEALVGVGAGDLAVRAREEARARLGDEDHRSALAGELAARALALAVGA
jgi:aerobic carbon-monoxide dehydrogenase medium subunit